LYRRLKTLFFSPVSRNEWKTIGGNRLKLKRVHKEPPIYEIENFLTESELEYFAQFIESCPFEKSFVDNMELDDGAGAEKEETDQKTKKKRKRRTILDSTHRTSTFYGFKKLHDSKISALEQRTADLLGCWVYQIEALQLVRYFPGQFFGVHHDMGDLMDNDEVSLPRKNLAVKRRLVTLFIYLNDLDDEQGGCTYFPKCGNLRVRPKKGNAVLWSNVTADGQPDPYTIHAGEAVQSAGKKDVIKYGLNVWICEE
jgi:prolyl 4-hydroxylase